jgi:hypothetical protein
MRGLERVYDETAAWSQYPLFITVYDRKLSAPDTFAVDADGSVHLPTEIYGLEFQDLRLPLMLSANGRNIESRGSFALPGLAPNSTRTLVLAAPTLARKILLFSNVTSPSGLAAGTTIARLKVEDDTGVAKDFALRAGYETSAWNARCVPSACAVAFDWRKRVALLGGERYSESYDEFDAAIFAMELTLDQATRVRSLELKRVPSVGALYIWGIALEP